MEKRSASGDEKPRQPNWTEGERLLAVSLINTHYQALFGKFKGATLGAKKKEALWQTVTDELNSSGVSACRRTAEQVKIMYKNVKARAKNKESDKHKTGGGPAMVLTPAEEEVMLLIGNRAQVVGIPGFDSDKVNESSSPVNTVDDNDSGLSEKENEAPVNPAVASTSGANVSATSDSVTNSGVKDNLNLVKSGRKKKYEKDDLFLLEIERAGLEVKLLKQRIDHENEKQEQERILFDLRKQVLTKNLNDAFSNGFINLES